MNRSTIIIVACGFVFALLAAIGVQMLGGAKKAPSPDEASKTISVLVAARDIKVGEELGAGSMTWTTWPQTSQFAGAILRDGTQKPEEALKGRVRRAVTKGEPMMTSVIIENVKSSFISASLEPGKRAITISVNAQSSVAGFVNPGDRVDVLLTYDVKLPGDEKVRKSAMMVVTKLASETVLENLKVLAVDQDTKKTDAKIGKTVTLQVAPKEAEMLTLASKMGTISLSLRSLGDEGTSQSAPDGKTAYATTDLRVSGVMREILKGENKSGSLSQVVRVYSGSRVDNVEVRPYTTR